MNRTTNFEAASTTSRSIPSLPTQTAPAPSSVGRSSLPTLTREYARLWRLGGYKSLQDRRAIGAAIHDVLVSIGGEWSTGPETWILTPDAEQIVAKHGDAAKWTTIARFDRRSAPGECNYGGRLLPTFRDARRLAADAKGVA